MIKFIVKKVIRKKESIDDPKVREAYGVLGGILGIFCNAILFIVKITIGLILNSLAIISDGFNNLSDMGASLVSVISAKFSNKQPDKDHPFGHGRLEYIASLIVAFLIVLMGVQIIISSVTQLIEGKHNTSFNMILIIILAVAILIKLWMFSYNRYLAKKINSSVLKAAAMDSLSDVAVSTVIIISSIVGYYVWPKLPLDAILGLIVAVIIAINGIKLAAETIGVLLGKKVDPEVEKKVTAILLSGEGVLGIHDLLIHDYGPGRKIASVHAEVAENVNIIVTHEIIDQLEKKVLQEMHIPIVIHMDPISTNCEITQKLRTFLNEKIPEINHELHFHDLRITKGDNTINVIFDLVIPFSLKNNTEAYIITLKDAIKQLDKRYRTILNIDYE